MAPTRQRTDFEARMRAQGRCMDCGSKRCFKKLGYCLECMRHRNPNIMHAFRQAIYPQDNQFMNRKRMEAKKLAAANAQKEKATT